LGSLKITGSIVGDEQFRANFARIFGIAIVHAVLQPPRSDIGEFIQTTNLRAVVVGNQKTVAGLSQGKGEPLMVEVVQRAVAPIKTAGLIVGRVEEDEDVVAFCLDQ